MRDAERFLHRQIPLTRMMQVSVENDDGGEVTLSAPLAENHNHLGTAFGGSLAALAMLAGYAWLWLELRDRAAHIVISESTLKFRRPVRGTLRATCERPDEETLAAFRAAFAANGKARLQLRIRIPTNDGETAVEFSGTYVARA